MMQHHWHNINDHLHYLSRILIRSKNFRREKNDLPDDDPSCGTIILGDGVILAVSESVSIQERIAATVEFGTDFALGLLFILALFERVGVVSCVGVRRRKLTRFKND
jgi:hypothetical protein